MKQCPECTRVYDDESLKFCLDDGDELVYGPAEPKTAILPSERRTILFDPPQATVPSPGKATETTVVKIKRQWLIIGAIGVILIGAIGVAAYWLYTDRSRKRIESLAVMPFVNETGNADMEYLSDGITDSLINSLSKIPS